MENNLENTPPVNEAKVEPFGEIARLGDSASTIKDETAMPNIVALENKDAKEAEEKAREDKVNAETAANLATVLKETNKGEISEIDGQMAKLKEEIGQLENQSQVIEGRINFQVMTRELSESGVERDEQKAEDEIAKIDEKLEDAIDVLATHKSEVANPLIWKNEDVMKELNDKLDEQVADMQAGKRRTGGAEMVEGVIVPKDDKAIDDFNRLEGPASTEFVMQQTVGGEMAAANTEEMIRKQYNEMHDSMLLIDQEYGGKEEALKSAAENERAGVRAELEKDKQHRVEEIAKANQTIDTLNKERAEVDIQLEGKKHELETLQIQKERKEKGIEEYSAQIEAYNQKVAESSDKFGFLAERIKELSEQGVTAVESLNNLEAAVDNRLANLEVLTQMAFVDADGYYDNETIRIKQEFKVAVKTVQGEYRAKISALEDQLTEQYPESYWKNEKGEFVPFPGLAGEIARKPIVEAFTPVVLKMEEDRETGILSAKEKDTNARETMARQKTEEYAQIEGLRKVAEEKLLNAKKTIGLVKEVAVEQFGTEPNTQKQKNIVSRVSEFVGKMFGRKS